MHSLKKRHVLSLQCTLLALLFVISALLVACSSGSPTTSAATSPTPTLSLQMGDSGDLSPTPTPLAYTCGAWVTQNTLPYGTNQIGVYAKFTKLVNGNPQGIDAANATATVHWPTGQNDVYTAQTTFDGLAVFTISVANHQEAIDKIILVTVHFEKAGVEPCDVDTNRPAFFSLIVPSPVATGTPGAKGAPPGGGKQGH
jgi:hypothetical protein